MRANLHARFPETPSRFIGASLPIFVAGLICGWLAKPLIVQERSDASRSSSKAVAGVAVSQARLVFESEAESVFITRLSAALSIRGHQKRERILSAIADDLDAAQVRAALAQLDKTRIASRERIRAHLLARWGEIDPTGAREYAVNLRHAREQRAALDAVVSGWAASDAAAASRWIAELPDNELKTALQETLIKTVAASDPQHAFALLRDAPLTRGSSNRFDIVKTIFENWAARAPRSAAAAAMELDRSVRNHALYVIAARWADADLPTALAWATSISDESPSRRLDDSEGQASPQLGVLQTWMRRDAEAAMNWLRGLPDGISKANLTQSICLSSFYGQPELGMALAQMMPEGSARQAAIGDITRAWAGTDAVGALTWAMQLNDTESRDTALKRVTAEWIRNDPEGARQWLESQPANAEKDRLLSDAVGVLLGRESIHLMPRGGFHDVAQTIAQIANPESRQSTYEKFAKVWLSKQPEAARVWIERSTLSQTVKARLLQSNSDPPSPP